MASHDALLPIARPRRPGFTLIELLVVISIIAILGLMAVPALLAATRRADLSRVLDRIEQAHGLARHFARTTPMPNMSAAMTAYGVVLEPGTDGQRPYCAVVYGTTGAVSEELRRPGSGGTVERIGYFELPATLGVTVASDDDGQVRTPATHRLVWFYRWGSGEPLQQADLYSAGNAPIGIGTPMQKAVNAVSIGGGWGTTLVNRLPPIPKSPICSFLGFNTRSQQTTTAIAIYQDGGFRASEVQ